MRHDALDNVTLELEYASRVNWSLLHAGVPFLFKLCVTGSLDLACELTLDLLIFSNRDNTTILLNNTRVRVTQDDVKAARNLASVSHADMVHQWLKRQAWSMGDNVEAATLSVRLPDGRAVSCPVEVSPPTYWYRAIDHAGRPTDRLPCTRVTIALRDAHPLPVISHGAHDCAEKAAYPPLAAAIAAFVDINDPYVRQDGQEDGLGSRVAEYVRVLEGEKTPSLSKVLESFYKVVLEKRNLRHVDFLHEYSPEEQAVRVLKSDRERGALCLDLVVLGCEVLESWGFSPIFILTDRGGHAVLGAWSEDKGFADGLPVCRDTQTFADLVKNKVVSVLDVTLALSQVSYDQASRDSPLAFSPEAMSGFVYAVDIAAARGWPRAAPTFRILPLHRPRAVAEWVVPYLERKFPADLQRQRAHITLRSKDQAGSGEMKDDGRLEVDLEHLDDPDALFIPARCEVPGEIEDITLDPSSKWHWPPAGLPRKNGKLALAVLANGGGGKSYLCRRLAKVMATCYLSDSTPSNPVPIFYPLRQFVRGASLLESLARHVGCSGPEDLAHAANHVPLLFILDALDESDFGRAAGSPKDYEELLQPLLSLANTSVFLTGRPAMFPGAPRRFLPPDFTIVYLKDWDKTDDLTSFLRACEHIKGIQFNGGWSTFYDVVFGPSGSQNLRELAKTPLLARMIVQTRDLIEREVRSGEKKFDELDLYRKYTGHCFQRKWTLTGQDLAAAAHKEIALSMYMTGRNALSADNISIDLAAYLMRYGINIWRQFSHHGCVVYGLLVPDKEKTFRFSHLSFEHYFLAERLADELRSSLASSDQSGLSVFSTVFQARQLAQGPITFLGEILRHEEQLLKAVAARLNVPAKRRKLLLNAKIASRPLGTARGEGQEDVAFRNLVLAYLNGGGSSPPNDLSGGLDFSGIDLSKVTLRNCNLTNSHMRGAILRAADLRGCLLIRADLREADLTQTLLNEADLRGCQLSHFRVSGEQAGPCLDQVKNLADVRLEPDDRETALLLERCKDRSLGLAHS